MLSTQSDTRTRERRHGAVSPWVRWQALWLLFLCAAASWGAEKESGAAAGQYATEQQWVASLQPLLTMPVQDSGFVRSAYTFAENHLMAIYGKRTFAGHSDVTVHSHEAQRAGKN